MQFRERSSGENRKYSKGVKNIGKGFPEATLSYVLGGGLFVDKQQSIMYILVLTHCAIKFQKLLEN